jgi:hypothetical protein
MMKRTTIISVVALMLFACSDDKREYLVRMRNTGSRDIDNARVSYGKFTSDAGILIPRADDTELAVREPLPTSAVVEWTDADGARHREVVKVALPQRFKGVLVFEIDGSNRARAVTESPPPHIRP